MSYKYVFGLSSTARTVDDVCRIVGLAWNNGVRHGKRQGIAKGVFVYEECNVGMV